MVDAAEGDGLDALLDRLRNGVSASDVALDAVRSLATQLLAELPVGAGEAAPAELEAALTALTQAAGALGTAPDPAALARFLADHVLGLPQGPLGGAAAVRENLLAALAGIAAAADGNLRPAGDAAAGRIGDAAAALEALDPTQAAQWQQVRAVLAAAAEAMNTYRSALRRIPPAVSAGLDAINLDRYQAQLRQALAALPVEAGIPNLGIYNSLDSLVDAALQPVDRTAEALAAFSADAIVGRLQEALQRIETFIDSLLAVVQDNPLLDRLNRAAQALATAIAAVQQGVQRALDGLLAAVDQGVGAIQCHQGPNRDGPRRAPASCIRAGRGGIGPGHPGRVRPIQCGPSGDPA